MQNFARGASWAEAAGVETKRKKPAYWLFKEEPSHYNFADLERESKTLWDGVDNNLARQNLRKVCRGDRALYYHTGKEKAVVAEILVTSDPTADPDSDDPKAVVVEVQPVRRLLHPVPLERIKNDPQLADWDLVRLPRLSVLPVSPAQWRRVIELSQAEG
jgi:predicted RNA-binding protein with PUA-like domain